MLCRVRVSPPYYTEFSLNPFSYLLCLEDGWSEHKGSLSVSESWCHLSDEVSINESVVTVLPEKFRMRRNKNCLRKSFILSMKGSFNLGQRR